MGHLSRFRSSSPGAAGRRPLPASLVGESDAARRARDAFELALTRTTPALVLAERGCRVLEIARALHAATRPSAPFVSIDCGTLEPAELVTRLFGITADAAATEDLERVGPESALLLASGGTLLLDNLTDLPASAQRRLARLLRDGEMRVGAARGTVALSCRVVAASSGDLDADLRDGRLRADLLRRFQATRIDVPPLRQRPSDLPALIDRLVAESDQAPRAFTRPALTVLAALPWPGNVDELASMLSTVMASSPDTVRQEDVLAHLPIEGAFARVDLTASLREARRRFERDYIAAVLEHHQWRMSDAARTLGIERANLYRKARQLGISRVPRAEVS